ncbi:MAG: protein kinase [Candidatus Obscuribacterales bacterium]|nr:protein kinase [Candidatus Obscuribacterales bacterium]
MQDSTQLIGKILNERYKVDELVGSGGWGNVYRALHITLNCDVAIKILHTHLSQDQTRLKRFAQEAAVLSQISSPFIIRTIDYGLLPVPFIAMEFLKGSSLADLIKEQRQVPEKEAIAIFLQVTEGLKYAHAFGLIHRDLKPANIFLTREAGETQCKILDFGLAKLFESSSSEDKLTATGDIMGSPPYMSPELWQGQTIDQRSDIYALGCIMYETLSGQPAFSENSVLAYLQAHLHAEPKEFAKQKLARKISPDLEKVVFKCLQKDPCHRYSSASDVQKDLESVRSGGHLDIQLLSASRTKIKWMAGATCAALLCALCFSLWLYQLPISVAMANYFNSQAAESLALKKYKDADSALKIASILEIPQGPQSPSKLATLRLRIKLAEVTDIELQKKLKNELDQIIGGSFPTPHAKALMEESARQRDINRNYAGSVALGTQALFQCAKAGKHSVVYAACLDNLSKTYLLMPGESNRATRLSLEAYKICSDLLEPDDHNMTHVLNDLALAFLKDGQYADAEKSFKQAIEVNKKGNTIALEYNYANLADCLRKQGKLKESLLYYEKALDAFNRYPRRGKVAVTNAFKNLTEEAATYLAMGDYKEAINHVKHAIEFADQNQIADSEKALAYATLAKVNIAEKDKRSAEKNLETAYGLMKDINQRGPNVLFVLRELVKVKHENGKFDDARELEKNL